MKLRAMRQSPARTLPDILDVAELLCRDQGNWTLDEVRANCERYGPPRIFDALRPHFE